MIRGGLVFSQELSSRLKVQECLGWRCKEPNSVIERGCAIVAPLIVRKVEGLARGHVCAIPGRGYESLRIIRSCKGNEACDDSKDNYLEGTQRTSGKFISSDFGQVIYMRHAQLVGAKSKKHLGTSVLHSARVNIICWRRKSSPISRSSLE